MFRKISIYLLLISLLFGLFSFSVFAQDYPDKKIEVIVMYGPGGGTDRFIRALQPGLEEALGVDLIIRNIEGGGGAVGFTKAALADSDGYTVTIPNNALFTLQGMGNVTFTYDDFDMLGRVTREDYYLCVGADTKWDNLEEYVADAKANPDSIKLASAGVGSSNHIVGKAIQKELGIELKDTPYGEGESAVVAAILGGHVRSAIVSPGNAIPNHRAGKFRILSVLGPKRSEYVPDVPTAQEQGIDFSVVQWRGIGAPAGVSDEVREVWEDAIKHAVKDEKFQKYSENAGASIDPLFGEELDQLVEDMANTFIPIAQEVSETD